MNYYTLLDSPIDPLLLTGNGEQLSAIYMDGEQRQSRLEGDWQENAVVFQAVIAQLRAYFGGSLRSFDLALAARGTDFQKRVWRALSRIPHGQTVSYKQIAEWISAPSAVRAVGLANGRNPIPIVVPCHRVIGSNGKLTGFSGGLDRKQWLLEHEAKQLSLLST